MKKKLIVKVLCAVVTASLMLNYATVPAAAYSGGELYQCEAMGGVVSVWNQYNLVHSYGVHDCSAKLEYNTGWIREYGKPGTYRGTLWIRENQGIIEIARGQATRIEKNVSCIIQNYGIVVENTGVKTSAGFLPPSTSVAGSNGVGYNYGTVEKNYGTVYHNRVEGVVEHNYGTVITNDGTIMHQYDKFTITAPEGYNVSTDEFYVERGGSAVEFTVTKSDEALPDFHISFSGIDANIMEVETGKFLLTDLDTSGSTSAMSIELRVDTGVHVHAKGAYHDAVAATCATEGTVEYWDCSGCIEKLDAGGAVLSVLIEAAKGHSFTTYLSNNDATCTADGTKTATCDNCCGATDTIADTGTAMGHTYGEWVITKESTETENGTKERTCSVCSDKDTDVIPVLPHAHHGVLQNGTSATCTVAGVKDYYTCSCGKTFEDVTYNIEIADFDAWKTEGGNGYIAHKGHSFTTYLSNNDATCTADGTKTATCDNCCGATDTIADTGTAMGHTYGDWVITKEPTSTEKGMRERACSVCDAKETGEIPVLTTVSYNIISGAGSEWAKGSSDELVLTSDADYVKFVCVMVDGEEVAVFNYTAVSGSTKVTLKAAYLETLSEGSHSFEIVSNDGSASANFTVKAANNPAPIDPTNPTAPNTGDNSRLLLWIILLFISSGALAGTVVYGKKRNRT